MPKLRFAMVCASNQNRSMEAHALLKKQNFNVGSYGVGAHVKLPGPSAREPNVYEFGTPYQKIFEELRTKNSELYTRNGLLQMLQRNMQVKRAPERWQNTSEMYDVVVTFEERVMEQVLEDFHRRNQGLIKSCLVVNIDVKDNHEEAANAAPHALRLCELLEEVEDWQDVLDDVMMRFETETRRRPTYTICFY